MKNKLYIAYGSNLNLPQMAQRCPTAKVVGASEIKDYALVFRGGRNGAVATIEPCEGSSVPVLLWKITPKDEAALDIYEGFPRFYDKQTIELPLDGKTVSAMTFEEPASLETALPEPENDLEMPLSDMADEEDQEPIDDSGGQPSSDETSANKESSGSWMRTLPTKITL